MLLNPILIMTCGRSGSSMISGIFAQHGIWVGRQREPDERNPKGFFENLELKKEIRRWTGGTNFTSCPSFRPGWNEVVKRTLESQGYQDERWLFKHGATFHHIWDEFKPKFIKVKRDKSAILKSFRKARILNRYSDDELKNIISYHHYVLDSIPGIEIHSEDVINGVYEDLIKAFDYCGLDFDCSIADDFVEKEYWHFS